MEAVINRFVENIPSHRSYLYPDELNRNLMQLSKQSPMILGFSKIGTSNNGRDIYMANIGNGKIKVFIIGFPHPNEIVGGLTIDYLVKQLIINKEFRENINCTWNIITALDVDGIIFNKKLFQQPFTPKSFCLNSYLQPVNHQIEFSYPVKYKKYQYNKPRPEAKVVIKMIHEIKPDFFYSLHNAPIIGGAFFYTSSACKELYRKYQEIVTKEGLYLESKPLDSTVRVYDKGIFELFSIKHLYKEAIKYNFGGTSYDYVKNNTDSFILACEVPYFTIDDLKLIRREVLIKKFMAQNRYFKELCAFLSQETVKKYMTVSNPFIESALYWMNVFIVDPKNYKTEITYNKRAIEIYNNENSFRTLILLKFLHMWILGTFVRGIEFELNTGYKDKGNHLIRAKSFLLKKIEEWNNEIMTLAKIKTVSLHSLVKIQLLSGLNTIRFLLKR